MIGLYVNSELLITMCFSIDGDFIKQRHFLNGILLSQIFVMKNTEDHIFQEPPRYNMSVASICISADLLSCHMT